MSDIDDMKKVPKFEFNLGRVTFVSEESPYIVMGNLVDPKESIKQLRVNISDAAKIHQRMYYTTDVATMSLILSKMTLRSSSLTYAKLNDKKEKERVGISQFAASRFITCFSHINHESVAFWTNYGGTVREKKVLLKFKNFAPYFHNTVYTDYVLLGGNKRVFFYSDEYNATINRNGIIGESIGFPKVNTDYDIRNCVRSIEMFDIEYLPAAHEAFTNDYSGKADIDFGSAVNASSNPSILQSVKVYKPECLGKQKSDPWDYEGESRVMSCLDLQDFDEWNFIDLRLKDEIFRDLIVVMSPWAVPDLENEIQNIISSSPLCDNIKHTITVVHSELEGTINI